MAGRQDLVRSLGLRQIGSENLRDIQGVRTARAKLDGSRRRQGSSNALRSAGGEARAAYALDRKPRELRKRGGIYILGGVQHCEEMRVLVARRAPQLRDKSAQRALSALRQSSPFAESVTGPASGVRRSRRCPTSSGRGEQRAGVPGLREQEAAAHLHVHAPPVLKHRKEHCGALLLRRRGHELLRGRIRRGLPTEIETNVQLGLAKLN